MPGHAGPVEAALEQGIVRVGRFNGKRVHESVELNYGRPGTLEHDLQLGDVAVGEPLARNRAPGHHPLPVGADCADAGIRAVRGDDDGYRRLEAARPERHAAEVLKRMAAYALKVAAESFGLELRVATVPVATVRAAGFDITVARVRVSPNYIQAMFAGGGMGYAEETDASRYFVDARVLSIFEGAEETLALKVVFGLAGTWMRESSSRSFSKACILSAASPMR